MTDQRVYHFHQNQSAIGNPALSDKRPSNAFEHRVQVTSDDIDQQRHASNVAIVDWMNQAAIAHSTQLGYDTNAYQRIGAMFVVRRHEIDYLASANLNDELICYTWPSFARKATAHRKHEIVRVADDVVIARGLNMWAFIDSTTLRPKRMPPEVIDTFNPDKFV